MINTVCLVFYGCRVFVSFVGTSICRLVSILVVLLCNLCVYIVYCGLWSWLFACLLFV